MRAIMTEFVPERLQLLAAAVELQIEVIVLLVARGGLVLDAEITVGFDRDRAPPSRRRNGELDLFGPSRELNDSPVCLRVNRRQKRRLDVHNPALMLDGAGSDLEALAPLAVPMTRLVAGKKAAFDQQVKAWFLDRINCRWPAREALHGEPVEKVGLFVEFPQSPIGHVLTAAIEKPGRLSDGDKTRIEKAREKREVARLKLHPSADLQRVEVFAVKILDELDLQLILVPVGSDDRVYDFDPHQVAGCEPSLPGDDPVFPVRAARRDDERLEKPMLLDRSDEIGNVAGGDARLFGVRLNVGEAELCCAGLLAFKNVGRSGRRPSFKVSGEVFYFVCEVGTGHRARISLVRARKSRAPRLRRS